MGKKLIILMVFIISLNTCLAYEDYTRRGYNDSLFEMTNSLFNDVLVSASVRTSVITSPLYHSLVADLDNDGTNEIIVVDSPSIKIFANSTLTPVTSIGGIAGSLPASIDTVDIDNDGDDEIIFVSDNSASFWIIDYNGTSITKRKIAFSGPLTAVSPAHGFDMNMLSCKNNMCAVLSSDQVQAATAISNDLVLMIFNSTNVTQTLLIDSSAATTVFCFPDIRGFAIEDYQPDGYDDIVFTYLQTSIPAEARTRWVQQLANGTYALEFSATKDTSNSFGGVDGFRCDNTAVRPSSAITAPAVFSAQGFPSKNSIIGIKTATDQFRMVVYDSLGNEIDTHPEFLVGEGNVLSNVAKGNFFDNTDTDDDYCVMGYDLDDQVITLLCGTQRLSDSSAFETNSWEIDYSTFGSPNNFNITDIYGSSHALIHSVQTKSNSINGNDVDEILTPYGVFTIDDATGLIVKEGNLELQFGNPALASSIIPVDVEKTGTDDLIALSSGNLFYIDDQFTNSPGTLALYEINPCITKGAWKINTSVRISVTVADVDNDLTSAGMVIYEGVSNEQSFNSTNATAGTIFARDFKANQTITTGILSLFARDVENYNTLDTFDTTFSVAANGVEFNDCITVVDVVAQRAAEEAAINKSITDLNENAITRAIREISGTGGSVESGLSEGIIWMGFMLFAAIGIISLPSKDFDGTTKVAILAVMEVLALFIGWKLEFISTGLVTIFVLIAGLVFAMWFNKNVISQKG